MKINLSKGLLFVGTVFMSAATEVFRSIQTKRQIEQVGQSVGKSIKEEIYKKPENVEEK